MAYPLYFPGDARRLFTGEIWLRRVANLAHWVPGARMLELVGSTAGLFFAKELLSPLTVADQDQAALKAIEDRARAAGLNDRLTTKQVSFGALPFAPASFDGILSLGRVVLPLETAAQTLRPLLAPKGRLVFTTVVQVGRHPAAAVVQAWEKQLGTALPTPREALMLVEKHGYEPETIETCSESELDDLYRDLEPLAAKAPAEHAKWLREEIALYRSHGGRTGATYGVVVARRKEPGEKPPAARDGG